MHTGVHEKEYFSLVLLLTNAGLNAAAVDPYSVSFAGTAA